jgi:hypothetical protein
VEDVVRSFIRNWGQPEFRNISAIEPFLQENISTLLTAIIGEIEAGKKDEYPTEDGVPVETYGYEANHNAALDECIALIRQRLEK